MKAYHDRWPASTGKAKRLPSTACVVICDPESWPRCRELMASKPEYQGHFEPEMPIHDAQGYCRYCGGGPGVNCVCDACQGNYKRIKSAKVKHDKK